jgi:hypothetical protein
MRVRLPNGSEIWAEAQALGTRESEVAGFDTLRKALPLDALQESIEGLAQLVKTAIDKTKPDKACVEFGLDLGIDSGQLTALWVKGTAKANVKITLSWES